MPGYLQTAISKGNIFTNSEVNDTIFRNSSINERILFGLSSNIESSMTLTNNSTIFSSGKNIGIGTSNPEYLFHLSNGIAYFENDIIVRGTIETSGITMGESESGESTLAGLLTTSAQPNITSLGTLTSLDVENNVTCCNIFISGDLNVQGSNTIINTEVKLTDQIIVQNDGTAPALIVTQTGVNKDVAKFFTENSNLVMSIKDSGVVGINYDNNDTNNKLIVNGNSFFIGDSIMSNLSLSNNLIVEETTQLKNSLNVYGETILENNLFINGHILKIPYGNQSNRPIVESNNLGSIYFNTDTSRFEGLHNDNI